MEIRGWGYHRLKPVFSICHEMTWGSHRKPYSIQKCLDIGSRCWWTLLTAKGKRQHTQRSPQKIRSTLKSYHLQRLFRKSTYRSIKQERNSFIFEMDVAIGLHPQGARDVCQVLLLAGFSTNVPFFNLDMYGIRASQNTCGHLETAPHLKWNACKMNANMEAAWSMCVLLARLCVP